MDNVSTLTAIDEVFMLLDDDSDTEIQRYAEKVRATMIAAVALYESEFLAHVAKGNGIVEKTVYRVSTYDDKDKRNRDKVQALCRQLHPETDHQGLYMAAFFALRCRIHDDLFTALSSFFNLSELPEQYAILRKRGVSAGMVELAKVISTGTP